MSVTERIETGGPSLPERPPLAAPPGRRQPSWRELIIAAAAVGALVAAGIVVAIRDGEEPPTTLAPTSTAAPPTTVPLDTATAVYPAAGSSLRFDEPTDAARGFAVDFVGFVDPVVGEFQRGDSQSGEIEIRPSTSGPVTTVLVRRLGESWWVLGAVTADIELQDPAALAGISSPVRLTGVSTAFEANVSVEIREDGARRPLGDGFVMGGSMGEKGPFDGTVTFAKPSASMGAIVLSTTSMEDGRLWEAAVVRVRFAPSEPFVPVSVCPDYSMARPQPPAGQMVVSVFFACDLDASPVASYRLVPVSPRVLRAALEQLLAGPTRGEADAGLDSWFSSSTATMLADVTVRDGHAVVDFHDLRTVIPSASSSAGSRVLLSQLDATVFQFSTVSSVIYRIEGDCEAFNEWLQFGGCEPRTR